jgi:uncharacterized membrane protein YidH (DUF202 family)
LTPAIGLVVVGVGLNVFYRIAKCHQVGKIGASTDIGGGLLVVIGYLLIAGGLILGIATVLKDRRSG